MENSLRARDQASGPTPALPRQIQPQFRGSRKNQQEIRPPRVEEVGQIANRINSSERGSRGKSTELVPNYFPITTYTDWSLYQYRVDFNPVQERTIIQRGLMSTHKKFLGAYIFDGTMLFSIKKFESDTTELISKRKTDDQTVIITLKFISIIKKGDYASIQVFNLLMHKCFGNLNLTLIGKNYYDADVKVTIPNHKLQLLPDYKTTVLELLKESPKTKNVNPNWMVTIPNHKLQLLPGYKTTVLELLIESSKTKNVNPIWMVTIPNHKLQLLPGYKTTVLELLIESSKTKNVNPIWMVTIPNHKLQLLPGYKTTVLELLIESSKTKNVNPIWMDTALCTNIEDHKQKNYFGLKKKVSTEALKLTSKSLKRKISNLFQNNTSLEIKPKFRKYNELSSIASNELNIDSLIDMMLSRFVPKLLNSEITNSTQYNTAIEMTESSVAKYFKSYTSASIDVIPNNFPIIINSRLIGEKNIFTQFNKKTEIIPSISIFTDLNSDVPSFPSSSMRAVTSLNDNLLLNKEINPALNMVVPSNVEILVLDENSEISTKDPKILINYNQWTSPRQFTDPSTGKTVNLPFALKRLDKRKK